MIDRKTIGDKLIRERICPNLLGFNYIIEAANLFGPKAKMQDIYKAVADKHGATPARVERAIRHAKERSPGYGHLTNAAFISMLWYELEQGASA